MTEAQLSTAVIENPEMLKYQRRQHQQPDQKGTSARETGVAASVAGVVNGESLEDIRKVRPQPGHQGHRPVPREGRGEQGRDTSGGVVACAVNRQDPEINQLGAA